MSKAQQIIDILELQPHPEGGYFKETYRSQSEISSENLGENYSSKRNFSTCIYFLLTSDKFSALHRIEQDEIWHFYDGSPIKLHMINSHGEHSFKIIGRNLEKGEIPQYIVPGGCWFAGEVVEPDSFSLIGCTVSPGFDFDDFELKSRSELTALFPDLKEVIAGLTHH
jgi:predicted cupin superfamily sugar epimerase